MHSRHLHVRVHSYLSTSRDVLGPSRITDNSLSHPVQSTHVTRFGQCSDLHGSGANYPEFVVLSGYGNCSRSRVAEAATRGAQFNARMDAVRPKQ